MNETAPSLGELSAPPEFNDGLLAAAVAPIHSQREIVFVSPDDIEQYVEEPLLPAVMHLYKLGVQTMDGNAHAGCLESPNPAAQLALNYDSLSPENQDIVAAMVQERQDGLLPTGYNVAVHPQSADIDYTDVELSVPYEGTVGDIQRAMGTLAGRFTEQPRLWAATTLNHLSELYGFDITHEDAVMSVQEGGGGYVIAKDGLYYPSQDHVNRANDLYRRNPYTFEIDL